jgi:hypothetical protein
MSGNAGGHRVAARSLLVGRHAVGVLSIRWSWLPIQSADLTGLADALD